MAALAEVGLVVGIDLVMVGAWTTWWHLGTFSSDDSVGAIVGRTLDFLSWTLLPCWGVAFALIIVAHPLVRRARSLTSVSLHCLITLLAPPLWAIVYCAHYDDLGYVPTAALVAEGAWIVTLQPLCAYFALHRLGETDR